MPIETTRKIPSHPILRLLIKYFWLMTSDESEDMDYWLIPVCNADLVVNLSAPITYTHADGSVTQLQGTHICGIRRRPSHVAQKGPIITAGAAFHPAGLYPFVSEPLEYLTDRTVPIESVAYNLAQALSSRLPASHENIFRVLEDALIEALDLAAPDHIMIPETIQKFCIPGEVDGIQSFCLKNGLSSRTLERHIRRHVGILPKQFQQLSRFQGAVQRLIDRPQESLTELAYDYGYCDQPHYNRDFIRLIGRTPSNFKARNDSVLERIRRK